MVNWDASLNETAILVGCWVLQWGSELGILPFRYAGRWLNSSTIDVQTTWKSPFLPWTLRSFDLHGERKYNLCIYPDSVLFLLAFDIKEVQLVTFTVVNTNTNPGILILLGEHLLLIFMLSGMKTYIWKIPKIIAVPLRTPQVTGTFGSNGKPLKVKEPGTRRSERRQEAGKQALMHL